jgi:hypothetical protein
MVELNRCAVDRLWVCEPKLYLLLAASNGMRIALSFGDGREMLPRAMVVDIESAESRC